MCALIDQDGNENRGKTMINQTCFMQLEIGDRVQVNNQTSFIKLEIVNKLHVRNQTSLCN